MTFKSETKALNWAFIALIVLQAFSSPRLTHALIAHRPLSLLDFISFEKTYAATAIPSMRMTSLWVVWHLTTADIFIWPTHRMNKKKTPNLKKSHFPRVTLAFRIWTLSSTNFLFHKAYSLWCFRCARQFWGCLAVVLVQKHGKTLILLEEGERTNDFICYCRWFWHNRMFFPSLISVYWIK